jgi:hypothetical protein
MDTTTSSRSVILAAMGAGNGAEWFTWQLPLAA